MSYDWMVFYSHIKIDTNMFEINDKEMIIDCTLTMKYIGSYVAEMYSFYHIDCICHRFMQKKTHDCTWGIKLIWMQTLFGDISDATSRCFSASFFSFSLCIIVLMHFQGNNCLKNYTFAKSSLLSSCGRCIVVYDRPMVDEGYVIINWNETQDLKKFKHSSLF